MCRPLHSCPRLYDRDCTLSEGLGQSGWPSRDGDALLRDTIGELLANNHRELLLNLAEVSYIDSSGLGVLVGAYTTVRKQGGELQLLNLTKRVRNLLQITKLYTVFTVSDDETAAIKSLNMKLAITLPVLADPHGKAGLERAAHTNVVV